MIIFGKNHTLGIYRFDLGILLCGVDFGKITIYYYFYYIAFTGFIGFIGFIGFTGFVVLYILIR